METTSLNTFHLQDFRSYRTYEEWKLFVMMLIITEETVLTVPMRNGNLIKSIWIVQIVNASSYRTYEEWKRISKINVLLNIAFVLTVPMRNGNSSHRPISHVWPRQFLPYL